MARAFISYSQKDSDFVERLYEDLVSSSSLTIRFDKICLTPGDTLSSIFIEIGEADFVLPVLSDNFIDSDWCIKELGTAIIKEIEEESFEENFD